MKEEINLEIYNTESRQKERIAPTPGESTIKMYTCGPTVYNFAHIGNFRTFVFEDLLRRTIKYFGMSLKQVMNFTDVDDKTIAGALKQNLDLKTYTKIYEEAFLEDLKTLEIEPVEIYAAATDYIPEMIEMIEILIKKGIAYVGKDGNIFFSIKEFPSYGRLSHLSLEDLKVGASERVSTDEYEKESVADFVLWKTYDKERDGSVFWQSPFGLGRPGWHIECSAMATKLLGPSIDIHVGGVDNMFPHHENEIAQSEGCSGKKFVRHWMHSEHLLVDGKKMSKSAGNFYTLRDLLQKGITGREIRYLYLQTHYRTQLNFTFQGLAASRHALGRFRDFIHRLRDIQGGDSFSCGAIIDETRQKFKKALGDDLNVSVALAALFDFIREINAMCDEKKISAKDSKELLAFLEEVNRVLSVLPLHEKEIEIPADINEAFLGREAARKAKNWKEADRFRDYIHSKGYLIEDNPQGSRIKKAEV